MFKNEADADFIITIHSHLLTTIVTLDVEACESIKSFTSLSPVIRTCSPSTSKKCIDDTGVLPVNFEQVDNKSLYEQDLGTSTTFALDPTLIFTYMVGLVLVVPLGEVMAGVWRGERGRGDGRTATVTLGRGDLLLLLLVVPLLLPLRLNNSSIPASKVFL